MSESAETIKTTIYLVRHGECKANLGDTHLPPDLDVLTEKGKLQAAAFGKHFHDVEFTRAYASTYPRAIDTATEILANLDGNGKPELKQDSRIREREMGIYENRPMFDLWDDLFAAAKTGTKLLDFEVEGGESVASLEERISSFIMELLESIQQSKKSETILIVSHGVIIMRMMFKLRAFSKDPTKLITLNSWDAKKIATAIKNTGYHLITVDVPKEGNGNKVLDIAKLHQSSHLETLSSGATAAKTPSKEYLRIAATFEELVNEQCITH
ncbi:unnamed protein product [Orchesella dallaii]|uniref:Fructose-2,6-bisphosphatase TIGAR n=1 Tax=Orchesella dallaii TaxID=48710 RepID=A0ABP1QBH2_9HEXA